MDLIAEQFAGRPFEEQWIERDGFIGHFQLWKPKYKPGRLMIAYWDDPIELQYLVAEYDISDTQ